MRKFYSNEKNWYKSYPAIIIYVIYLSYLALADKFDHTSFVLGCSQCGILFITKNSNYGRDDILCPFGCRQNRQKIKSRERSKRHYKKLDKKNLKKKLNRARSEINNHILQERSSSLKMDPFLSYLKLILSSILKIKIELDEIIDLQGKVRSRGLSFYQRLVHYFGYG